MAEGEREIFQAHHSKIDSLFASMRADANAEQHAREEVDAGIEDAFTHDSGLAALYHAAEQKRVEKEL